MVNAANLDQVAEAGLTQVCFFVRLFICFRAAFSLHVMSSFSFQSIVSFFQTPLTEVVSPRFVCQRGC